MTFPDDILPEKIDQMIGKLNKIEEEFTLQMGKYESINDLEDRVDNLEKRVEKLEEIKQ